jgi:hypothetical protein
MKKRIEEMLQLLQSGRRYDNEIVHDEYDRLLEDFILSDETDEEDLGKMKVLIALEKRFWYA